MILDDRHFPASVGREGRSRVWDQREVVAWAKPGGVRSVGGSLGGAPPAEGRSIFDSGSN